MNQQEIENAVLTVLASVLKADVDLNSSRDNTLQWDSLKHIEVIFALEDELSLRFSEIEMVDMNSVNSIVQFVMNHRAT